MRINRKGEALRQPAGCRSSLTRALAAALALCALCALAGCGQAQGASDSPRLADVRLSASSSMTEASQSVEIRLVFDQGVSVAANAADDFEVLLNGGPLDGSAVALDVRGSADGVTFVLHPASGASTAGGKGTFFALYQSGFSVAAKRADGALAVRHGGVRLVRRARRDG